MSSKQDDVGIWLPIYIGEMLAMTTRFSTEQIGALYLLMLDYWTNGGIPEDYKVIAAITGLSTVKAKTFIKLLLSIQLFENDDGMLFSPYFDAKKQTATINRKMKLERAKKGSDARWGRTVTNDSNNDSIETQDNLSNAQATSKLCTSNANDVLEQCPSSLSLSNSSSLSKKNKSNLSVESIKHWVVPKLDDMNTLLKKASASAPVLNAVSYDNHVKNFKTYYVEEELKNNPILTDERRKDVLITWISNDRQYRSKPNKKKEDYYATANSSKTNAFDSAVSYVKQSSDAVDSYFDAMEQTWNP